MKNIKFKTLKEISKGEKYYMLFKISVESCCKYCVAIKDNDFCIHGISDDFNQSKEVFRILSNNEVSAIHLGDIISDIQNEIFT